MSRTARAATVVELPPESALALWSDTARWPTFVEGFGHVVEDRGWPENGSKLVWQSRPGGRGRVTERVLEHQPGRRLSTEVFEEALAGTQTVSVEPAEEEGEEGTRVELALEYELARGGPLRGLADFVFIRRALRDAQERTLRRFRTEAAEEAGL